MLLVLKCVCETISNLRKEEKYKYAQIQVEIWIYSAIYSLGAFNDGIALKHRNQDVPVL